MKQMNVTVKEIGDAVFYIKPFPAFTSANIAGELTKLLTPILGALVAIFTGGDKEEEGGTGAEDKADVDVMDTDIEAAIPSLVTAMSTLDGEKVEDMMKKLLVKYKNISVECELTQGAAKVLTMELANEIFCGEIQDMFILCFEVAKVNFGGFFKKLGGRFGNLVEVIQKATPSTTSGENLT